MSKFETQRRRLITTIAALSLLLTTLCGVAQAKYITNKEVSGTVQITVQLGSIALQEHEAIRKADGSYTLNGNVLPMGEKKGNAYILMPGVDVPKDPYVVISEKTPIKAYVYIKVDSSLPATVTYSLEDHWQKVIGHTGVYVYAPGGTPKAVEENIAAIPIIKTNTLTVSQYYSGADWVHLNFTAYMYQTAVGNTPEAVYQYYNP